MERINCCLFRSPMSIQPPNVNITISSCHSSSPLQISDGKVINYKTLEDNCSYKSGKTRKKAGIGSKKRHHKFVERERRKDMNTLYCVLRSLLPEEYIMVILNDPFLGKQVQEGNFVTVPLRDEFMENARLFIFETYCRIHQCIDIRMLADKLNMSYDEAERWIVNLVKNAKLDAKIDSTSGTVVMGTNHTSIYEQIIENTKQLSMRTYVLANNVVSAAVPAAQASSMRVGI